MRLRAVVLALLTAGCASLPPRDLPLCIELPKDSCPCYVAVGDMEHVSWIKRECPSPSPLPSATPVPEPSASPSASPSPTPSPTPSATPEPSPSPKPSPTPTPAPSPSPDPHEGDELADDLKIGANNPVKKDRGYRNTFNVTPTFRGKPIGPESGLGLTLIERYGEIRGMIVMPDGRRDGFEHQGCSLSNFDPADGCKDSDFYLFVDATNSAPDSEWDGDTYLAAGKRTYCVTWDFMDHWRCQRCELDRTGKQVGCGSNAQGFDLPK